MLRFYVVQNYNGNPIYSSTHRVPVVRRYVSCHQTLRELEGSNQTYHITNNFEIANRGVAGNPEMFWQPIQNFSGRLVGGGHTINMFRQSFAGSTVPSWGLFMNNRGVLENFRVSGEFVFYGNSNISVIWGVVASRNFGEIRNVTTTAYTTINVHSAHLVGGLAGLNSGLIYRSVNNASITASAYTGGIAGQNDGEIRLSNNTGRITLGFASFGNLGAGGITGINNNRLSQIANSGAIATASRHTFAGQQQHIEPALGRATGKNLASAPAIIWQANGAGGEVEIGDLTIVRHGFLNASTHNQRQYVGNIFGRAI
jgi:hypothetical protein